MAKVKIHRKVPAASTIPIRQLRENGSKIYPLTAAEGVVFSDGSLLSDKSFNGISYLKVNELPATGDPSIIYLVAAQDGGDGDFYDEYIWIESDNAFERNGHKVDLSNYATLTNLGNLYNDTIDYVDSSLEREEKVIATSLNDLNTRTKTLEDYNTNLETTLSNFATQNELYALQEDMISYEERQKLAGIAAGAEVNVQADWNETDTTSDAYIANKPTNLLTDDDGQVISAALNDLDTRVSAAITGISVDGTAQTVTNGVVDLSIPEGVWSAGEGEGSAILTGTIGEANGAYSVVGGKYNYIDGQANLAFGAWNSTSSNRCLIGGDDARVFDTGTHNAGATAIGYAWSIDIKPIGEANTTSYTATITDADLYNASVTTLNAMFKGSFVCSSDGTLFVKITDCSCTKVDNNTINLTFTTVSTLSETALTGETTFTLPGTYANYWSFAFNGWALGARSFAAGRRAMALNSYGVSIGNYTLTKSTNAECAFGTYNASNPGTTFSVGIGSSTLRKNGIELNGGKFYVNGIGTYDGTNPVSGTNDLASVLATKADNASIAFVPGTGSSSATLNGSGCLAIGDCSVAEGESRVATGAGAHAEGSYYNGGDTITISGDANSTTYTTNTEIEAGNILAYNGVYSKISSVVNNSGTYTLTLEKTLSETALSNTDVTIVYGIAYGWGSHSEGLDTCATNLASHSEGRHTLSSGQYSHAEGHASVSEGTDSHAEGRGTITTNLSEHSQGSYNVSNKANTTFGNAGNTIHSIGIGSSSSSRRNAVEVMQNGDVYIKGIGSYDGTTISGATSLASVISAKADSTSVSGKEDVSNKVTSLSASSTDTQYPSAKCVYDLIGDIESVLDTIINGTSNNS